jgi:hypothetical protein
VGDVVNVLIDRHQASLFYAMQRLFEDRLSGTVHTPIGMDWWTEGYWRFGEVFGDDRLAQQYLTIDGRWRAEFMDKSLPAASWDSHYPERLIRGVTLQQARAMPWAYVVATVQENQHGFDRFAREVGAKSVYQVGNTNQQVDWSLDPLAIVTSEVPIRGRGVLVRQEFDSDTTFRFRELPDNPAVIRSFVNCFSSTYCHPLYEQARALLPGFEITNHGIDGPDGNIEPTTKVAQLMASAGWGWHDKVQGDGFGHVIHDWAAIGRPLIGHASHYRGLMGEVFWEDEITAIDLDRHTLDEAMGLVREITGSPHHAGMSHAIRATFDREVDWERDAAKVRELLA